MRIDSGYPLGLQPGALYLAPATTAALRGRDFVHCLAELLYLGLVENAFDGLVQFGAEFVQFRHTGHHCLAIASALRGATAFLSHFLTFGLHLDPLHLHGSEVFNQGALHRFDLPFSYFDPFEYLDDVFLDSPVDALDDFLAILSRRSVALGLFLSLAKVGN